MDSIRQNPKSVPHQDETPRYEKPAVKKIGNMSANTKVKSIPD
jgi:hypothetical protein